MGPRTFKNPQASALVDRWCCTISTVHLSNLYYTHQSSHSFYKSMYIYKSHFNFWFPPLQISLIRANSIVPSLSLSLSLSLSIVWLPRKRRKRREINLMNFFLLDFSLIILSWAKYARRRLVRTRFFFVLKQIKQLERICVDSKTCYDFLFLFPSFS